MRRVCNCGDVSRGTLRRCSGTLSGILELSSDPKGLAPLLATMVTLAYAARHCAFTCLWSRLSQRHVILPTCSLRFLHVEAECGPFCGTADK